MLRCLGTYSFALENYLMLWRISGGFTIRNCSESSLGLSLPLAQKKQDKQYQSSVPGAEWVSLCRSSSTLSLSFRWNLGGLLKNSSDFEKLQKESPLITHKSMREIANEISLKKQRLLTDWDAERTLHL